MKKRVKSSVKVFVVLAVLVVLALVYFGYLANKPLRYEDEDVELTHVQELLLNNLDKKYPATPKEVVKLYSEITKAFYDEEYTEEELYDLVEMSYQLFDDELKKKNPIEQYYENLQKEIAYYAENRYVIKAYNTSSSVDIEKAKFEKDGYTWTKVYGYYTMRYGTKMTTIEEVYVLRKDKAGYWRIFGWDLVEE